jgi:acetyl esterase/lipase
MDVYMPPDARAAPVILMVHGGAWILGDKESARVVENKMRYWMRKGFIFISVDYPLFPRADPTQQADDVAKALAFAQTRARQWGGDPARFVLMGHSAGAYLVALVTADPSIAKREGAKPWLGTVALDSGAYDLPRIMARNHYRFYDRVFRDNPSYWRKASPIDRISEAGPPMFLVCSTVREHSCPEAHSFADALRAKGRQVSVYSVALKHRQVNEDLGLPGGYTDAVGSFLRSIGANSR